MEIKFSKYQGTGNDFVIIDNRTLFFDKSNTQLIHDICQRRFGVGADGLMLLENDTEVDFKMIYYNADGNESTMCGNGGRCIVAFAKKLGVFEGNKVKFRAIDGLHEAELVENNTIKLQMNCDETIEKIDENTYYLNTGSPHVVKIVESMPNDFVAEAKKIRHSERFNKEGVNVNFLSFENNTYKVRTFERGVEDETFSCGTGAVACGLLMKSTKEINFIQLETKGGFLSIDAISSKIYLIGSVKEVFCGKL